MKWIVIALLLTVSVQGLSDNVNMTGFVGSSVETYLNITLEKNATLFIDPVAVDSRLNISYPASTFYGGGNFSKVNITVVLNEAFTSNATLNASYVLHSDANNNTLDYLLQIHVVPEDLVTEETTFFIDILNGEYIINVSSTLLPKSGELLYRIGGIAQEQLNISCPGEWLGCPESKVFDNEGIAKFAVAYVLPPDTPVGRYSFPVNLTSRNLSIQRNITFVVENPSVLFQRYVFEDRCFLPSVTGELLVTLDCLKEQEEFNNRKTVEYVEQLRTQFNVSCDPEIITEHLYVGNVKEEVVAELRACRTERTAVQTQLTEANRELNRKDYVIQQKDNARQECMDSIQQTVADIVGNESTCLETVFGTSVRLKAEADAQKRTILWSVFLVILLAGLLYKGYEWYNERWRF